MPRPPVSPRLAPAEDPTAKSKQKRKRVAECEDEEYAEVDTQPAQFEEVSLKKKKSKKEVNTPDDESLPCKSKKPKKVLAEEAPISPDEAEVTPVTRKKSKSNQDPEKDATPVKSKKNKKASADATEDADATLKKKKTAEGPITETADEAPVPKKTKKISDEIPAVPFDANGVLTPAEFREKHFITLAIEGQTLPDPIQRFEDAPFSNEVCAGLVQTGFKEPSSIQAQGWPLVMDGKDLVAVAKTGSGKTLAFLLPAFEFARKLNSKACIKGASAPSVLVLAPTRELAAQLYKESEKFKKYHKICSVAVFGGVPKPPQAKALKEDRPECVIATPGRLQDLMEMEVLTLDRVQFLVLDEADMMLDMGFEPTISEIVGQIPSERQTLLFTATWPKAVKRIAASYLKKDHVHVNVGQTEELAANKAVNQTFYAIGDDEKEVKLWRIIGDLPDDGKVIVFMNTKRRVEQYRKAFVGRGFEVAALHGDKSQWERDRDLASFASGEVWLLFATDVCARGLDIKSVTHVVNFDMARDVEAYIHRIGRTGRAGAKGESITFWNVAYDMECSPALVKIAKEAGQEVPEFLENAAKKQKQAKTKLWKY